MNPRVRAVEAYLKALRTGEASATVTAARYLAPDVVLDTVGAHMWGNGHEEFVGHEVEADLGLLAHYLGDAGAQRCRSGRLVRIGSEREDFRWSDQATRKCGQNSLGAALHSLIHQSRRCPTP
jgi:hypothetical protein